MCHGITHDTHDKRNVIIVALPSATQEGVGGERARQCWVFFWEEGGRKEEEDGERERERGDG